MTAATTNLSLAAAPALEMRNVRKRFGATIALDGVSLAVNPGEVLALVGQNGAGKSTLMKVLSGAERADSGDMFLAGKPYQPRNPQDARLVGVAMIYQELSLAPHLSVAENILLGMEPKTLGFVRWKDLYKQAADAMAFLGHPEIRLTSRVADLPPATRQLIEIARALALGSKVLVLDEPTSSLAQNDIRHLFELIRRLRSQGQAIVYISHFLEEVKEITDRYVVLRDGRSVGNGVTAQATAQHIVSLMVGKQMGDLYPRTPRTQGEPLLEIKDLAGRVKPTKASLTVHRGEIVGIAGLVGAGRTELMRAVFGLDPVVSGAVKVASAGPADSPHRAWTGGMGLVSEDRKTEGLALGMSIADNLTLAHMNPLGPHAGVARLRSPARQEKIARNWIDLMQVRCRSPWQPIGDLSGGNQQKVAIARLLYGDCDVLLLDEPTRGIDVGSKAHIYSLLDKLASGTAPGTRQKAVLVVSSYLPELLGLCDRIAVMRRGVLGPARPVEQWTEHELLLACTQESPQTATTGVSA